MSTSRETLSPGQRVEVTNCQDYVGRNGMTGIVKDIAPQNIDNPIRKNWPVNVHLDDRRGDSFFSFDELTVIQ